MLPCAPQKFARRVIPETEFVSTMLCEDQAKAGGQPSMKFDNKVCGTAWIDDLKLEPITPHSPE